MAERQAGSYVVCAASMAMRTVRRRSTTPRSAWTVRNHTHNIFEKLGVPNRLAAVTLAFGQCLI